MESNNSTVVATLDRAKTGEERKAAAKVLQNSHVPVVTPAPLAHTLGNAGVPIAAAGILARLISELQARVAALESR